MPDRGIISRADTGDGLSHHRTQANSFQTELSFRRDLRTDRINHRLLSGVDFWSWRNRLRLSSGQRRSSQGPHQCRNAFQSLTGSRTVNDCYQAGPLKRRLTPLRPMPLSLSNHRMSGIQLLDRTVQCHLPKLTSLVMAGVHFLDCLQGRLWRVPTGSDPSSRSRVAWMMAEHRVCPCSRLWGER